MFFDFLCEGISRVTVNEPAPFLYEWSVEAGQTEAFDDAVADTCKEVIRVFQNTEYYADLKNITAISDITFPVSLKMADEISGDDFEDIYISVECKWEEDPNHFNNIKYRLRSRLFTDIIGPHKALAIREDQLNLDDQYRASPHVYSFIEHITQCFDAIIRNDAQAVYAAYQAAEESRNQVTQVGQNIQRLINQGGRLNEQEQLLVDLIQEIYDAMGEELADLHTAGRIMEGG